MIPAAVGQPDVVRFFTVLAVLLLVAKFAGAALERLRQPAVLGELLAGILLGAGVLKVFPVAPDDPLTSVFRLLAEVGVVVLLFEIGLGTDLQALARLGTAAASVSLVGVAVSLAGGWLYWQTAPHGDAHTLGAPATTALFVGAALTATSIGISARALSDLAVLNTLEAQLILGAAVIDDVLGLVLLGVTTALAAGAAPTLPSLLRSLGVAVGFLGVALWIGLRVAPRIFGIVAGMQARGVLSVSAFAFLLLLSGLAARAGSGLMIVGAFAAGLILSQTKQVAPIVQGIKPVADLVTPIFFLSVGAAVDPQMWNPLLPGTRQTLVIGGTLFAIAMAGKFVSGWAVPWRRFNRVAVGLGMAPRGEVALIFAQIGLAAGVFSSQVFNAILFVVVATTLVAPPLLRWTLRRGATLDPAAPA